MLAKIIERLLDVYSKIIHYNSLPVYSRSRERDSFNMETAINMVNECEQMIHDGEKLALDKLDKIEKDLKDFVQTILKFKTFDCECDNTMKYIRLHSKSRDGLQNRVTELEESVENVAWQVRKTISSIQKSHRLPKDTEIDKEKRENIDELLETFDKTKVKYKGFEERFDRLYNYLECKLQPYQAQAKHVSQATKYLDGKSDVFLSFLEEEDNEFIENDLGGSTPEIQEVLRNSLKEVMFRRGFSLENTDVDEETEDELSDEQESLLGRLDMFYSDIISMEKGMKFFQNLVLSTDLQDLQTFGFLLHELKMEMKRIKNPHNL